MLRFSRRLRLDFFFSFEIFKIETFQSRLGCINIFIKIVKTNWDCRDLLKLSRLIENCQDFSTLIEIFWILDICGRWWVMVLPWLFLAYLGLPPPPSTDFYNLSKYLDWDMWKIKLFLNQDQEKNWEIHKNHKSLNKSRQVSTSLDTSWSWSRSTGFAYGHRDLIEKSRSRPRFLDRWD